MVRTFELHLVCPDIRTQQDEIIVHQTMESAPGVGRVEIDRATGRVLVVTANQDGGTDVLWRLDMAGYPARLDS